MASCPYYANLGMRIYSESSVSERLIDSHIHKLMKRPGEVGDRIETVPGVSYCFRSWSRFLWLLVRPLLAQALIDAAEGCGHERDRPTQSTRATSNVLVAAGIVVVQITGSGWPALRMDDPGVVMGPALGA